MECIQERVESFREFMECIRWVPETFQEADGVNTGFGQV
jgi:hypothetical protein